MDVEQADSEPSDTKSNTDTHPIPTTKQSTCFMWWVDWHQAKQLFCNGVIFSGKWQMNFAK